MNKRAHYTDAEQAKLRKLYGTVSPEELLAAFPNRTMLGLRGQAKKMGICKDITTIEWSPAEDAVLRQHYASSGPTAVTKRLTRSLQAVKQRASRLGLTMQAVPRAVKLLNPARPTEHSPVPKAANTLRPMLVGAKPEPVKRSPLTPNLNARVEQRRQSERQQEQKPRPYVTAAEVRALPAAHPARLAYTKAAYNGPAAATEAFYAAMKQVP